MKKNDAKLNFEDVNLKDGTIDKISIRAISSGKKTVRKNKDSVAKIDSKLLVEVERFISLDENKFKYVNRKQFIDVAVAEFLHKKVKNG